MPRNGDWQCSTAISSALIRNMDSAVCLIHQVAITIPTSFPGSFLFLPRESTLVSAGHVSPLSKQLPTRVDSLFFKKRRKRRMQIFSNWHEGRGMEVISSLFFSKTGMLKKSTVYYLRRFRSTNNADFPSTKYFTVG